MTTLPALTILTMFGAAPDGNFDRPQFETQQRCTLSRAMYTQELKRMSLDPSRFECVETATGTWEIRGKMRETK